MEPFAAGDRVVYHDEQGRTHTATIVESYAHAALLKVAGLGHLTSRRLVFADAEQGLPFFTRPAAEAPAEPGPTPAGRRKPAR